MCCPSAIRVVQSNQPVRSDSKVDVKINDQLEAPHHQYHLSIQATGHHSDSFKKPVLISQGFPAIHDHIQPSYAP